MNEDNSLLKLKEVVSNHHLEVFSPPQYKGRWEINESFHVHCTKRPKLIHRWYTRIMLGWIWKDNE